MWYLIVSIPDLCTLTYFARVGRSMTYECDITDNACQSDLDVHCFARCIFQVISYKNLTQF